LIFLYLGYKKVLKIKDLYDIDESMSPSDLPIQFNSKWDRYRTSKRPLRLMRAFIAAKPGLFLSPILPNLLRTGLIFSQPFLIGTTIDWISSKDSKQVGYLLLLAYFIVYVGIAVFTAFYWHELDRWATSLRGSLITIIYEKTLQLDLKVVSEGASVSLMSTDVEKAVFGLRQLQELVSGVIVVVIALVLLHQQIGLA